jgi:DNA-binding NtrC family response regulator
VGISALRPAVADDARKDPSHADTHVAASGTTPAQAGADADATHPMVLGLPLSLAQLERMAILEALRRVNGNRTHAARLLGISLRTLRNKVRALRVSGDLTPDGRLLPGASAHGAFASGAMARGSHEESAA